jgi:hypothetical protein
MLRDSFSIVLNVRHPSRNPASIAKALGVKPWVVHSKLRARLTYFQTVLQSGNSPAKFRLALPKLVKFLRNNKKFWRDLTADKGSGELVFNYAISPQTVDGDKCFELFLTPVFCKYLSSNGIGLKI